MDVDVDYVWMVFVSLILGEGVVVIIVFGGLVVFVFWEWFEDDCVLCVMLFFDIVWFFFVYFVECWMFVIVE